MRLTTLEVKGFKSFGDKVTIHFDKGVTSIVGPNGSGKSNVVDAMRWVLGEQKTRMLRSEKMENIIFNGTKTRKPSNLAQVSITFENTKNILPTEYSSVTVTRRLYRSGESEYLLNDVSCRLKDITDLFLDTGIGSDSYAIIELKMVDEILNDKNNSIKLLFEEAAGISKYKMRKKQTLSRLEETDADLSRVNDLLFEIERNMKTLESQAKKTERYYKLKEQYKELSTELALFSVASSKITFDELQSQEEKQIEERIALEAQVGETEAGLQKEKLNLLDKEKELSEAQKVFNEKLNFIREQENEKKISNEKAKHLRDKEESLQQHLASDKISLVETQKKSKQQEEEKFNEEKNLVQLQEQLQELRALVDAARLQHDSLKSEISQMGNEAHTLQLSMHESEKTFAVAQAKKDSVLKEIERLKNDLLEKNTSLENISSQLNIAEEEKGNKERSFENLSMEDEQLTKNISSLEEELKKINSEIMAESRKLDSKQNEFNLTKSLLDNLEGYPESLRYIRKSKTSAAHAPLLSDVLNCKTEYKSALEIYLEPFMNYFVIDEVEDAATSLNLLSEASKGRANFFILKNFREEKNPSSVEIKDCVRATNVIEVEEKYRALCNHLLRNVFIVTQNQDSTPFLNKGFSADGNTPIFLSQNGKYSSTSHTLSGGSVGLFDGKRMGRTQQLEQLSEEITSLTSSLEKIKSEHKSTEEKLSKTKSQKENISSQKKNLQNELNNTSHEFATLSSKAEHLLSSISNNKKLLNDLALQLAAVEGAFSESNLSHHEHLQEIKSQHDLLRSKLDTLQNQFATAASELEKQNDAFNKHNIVCIQQQNNIATITRDLAYKTSLQETLSANIERNTAELEKIQLQTVELVRGSSDFDSQLVQLYNEKEILEQKVSSVEKEYFHSRGECDVLDTKIRDLRHRKEQVEQLAQAIKDKTTELKFQLNSLKERLSVEFNIVLEEILDKDPSPDWTEEELRDKVSKQKSQIENFGAINPMAVEAYNEINERFTFINAQKEDLAKAKESLLQTISEIEITAKENFMTAFVSIRENFVKVFRSLFTEDDDCDLILLDPANPTESDIQIIAKPKGKRPLSISQLSGGEKTLTATALLFSIYLLKPAPFCIFDEVDAPLDDTNIDKFNQIIKKFSADSQFIIITHNKRTMAATNIMYGVTMVEAGVTQLVPVDLTEVEEKSLA